MNEIIKIEQSVIGAEKVNSVNSRDIYEYLEVKRQYADWIKTAIDKYDFIEGEDFTIHKFVNGRATQSDYIVTLDMAKELCMVSNTPKGRETRKYFIEVEKKNRIPQNKDPMIAQMEMLISMRKEQLEIANRVDAIEMRQKEAQESLNSIEPSSSDAKDKTTRNRINEIVRAYCSMASVSYTDAWGKLYKEFYYRYNTNVNKRAKNQRKTKLDVVEDMGMLHDLYALASEIFLVKKAS
jgi:anti-repressor protein